MRVQCSPFIMLYLGSIGMIPLISELCLKETILQRNYRKMTIHVHFPITPLENSMESFLEPQHEGFISKSVL